MKTPTRALAAALLGGLLLIQLSGCGWRLRGAISVPPALQRSCLTGVAAYSDLAVEIRSTLERAGAKVLDSCAAADAQLRIGRNEVRKRVLSVDASGRAAEFELTYNLQFTVVDQAGDVLVRQQAIEISRDYRFDPDNVLAKGEEEKRIREEMVSFAVRQMMQRIDAATGTNGAASQ